MTEQIKDLIELYKLANKYSEEIYCSNDFDEGLKIAYETMFYEIEEKLEKYLTTKELYDIIMSERNKRNE